MSSLTTQKDSDLPLPKVQCTFCCKEFEYHQQYVPLDPACPACQVQRDISNKERESTELKSRLLSKWIEICPPAFRETDIKRLPCGETSRKVLTWKFNPRGIILNGPTGTGKTRTVWLLLKGIHMDNHRISIINSMSAIRYASQFSESAQSVEKWIDYILDAGILFMDDPFKVKLTDSFESALFSIVDHFTAHLKPIIVTLNDTGETLAGRMTGDRSGPIIRRLRDACESVTFHAKP